MNILIAESGSSKTDWRLIKADGQKKAWQGLGINPYYQNAQDISRQLQSELQPNIDREINQVFYYGTGVTNTETSQILKDNLFELYPKATIEIHDDLLAAARATCLHETGIACILGTGANVCLYDGANIVDKVGPLGFWMGDEGSGGYLGKEFIKMYLRNELPMEIRERFEAKYGILERTVILQKAYKEPFPNRYFASFSKFIWDQRRHPFMHSYISGAFDIFIEKNIKKLPNYQKYKVNFVGSVAFYYSDILRKNLEKQGITLGLIAESPISGLMLYHGGSV